MLYFSHHVFFKLFSVELFKSDVLVFFVSLVAFIILLTYFCLILPMDWFTVVLILFLQIRLSVLIVQVNK